VKAKVGWTAGKTRVELWMFLAPRRVPEASRKPGGHTCPSIITMLIVPEVSIDTSQMLMIMGLCMRWLSIIPKMNCYCYIIAIALIHAMHGLCWNHGKSWPTGTRTGYYHKSSAIDSKYSFPVRSWTLKPADMYSAVL
jgi:hypothetical protein